MPKVTFEIPVKLYTKAYLENKYGSPVKFFKKDIEGKFLFALLQKQQRDQDSKFSKYPHRISVCLTEGAHFRHGTVFTKTAVIDFNAQIEDIIKSQMRSFIYGMMQSSGMQLSKAVRLSQDNFKLPEEVMPFDCIKKDYQRWLHDEKKKEIQQKQAA